MSLSCYCKYEPEPGDVLWDQPSDYKALDTKAPRKCCSCGAKLETGATVVEFPRHKVPDCDYEWARFGEEYEDGPKRASRWMCERCGDLYYSLDELGYCINPEEDQRELVKEYAAMHQASAS